ncbi:MAG: substrate-binding domain-containing protein [Opitutales bacterium]|nr:substrate-binding domain-containing protein [Opitutales bacterium]
MKGLPRKKRICVSLNTTYNHQREIFHGIQRFARGQKDWRLLLISYDGKVTPEIERIESVDGVIGFLTGEGEDACHLEAARAAAGNRVVSVSGQDSMMKVPRVLSEDLAVGRMAADYLTGLGYEHFAFFAESVSPGYAAMDDRAQGFSERLLKSGRSCGFFQQQNIYKSDFHLKPNTAIFTFNLSVARLLIEELAERMIAVPEEVAVLGVDKDPFLQKISAVPISSIALNSEKIGYEAAGLLKRLLDGEEFEPGFVLRVPSLGVESRTSTEAFKHEDPIIRKTLGLLRREIANITSVAQCAALVGSSRSTLERRFRDILGRTVREVIESTRIDYTKSLLRETDLTITEIAASAGFGDSRMLSVVFRRVTGRTPSEFRRRMKE